MGDEDLELAKEHIHLAEDLVSEKMKKSDMSDKSVKEFSEAQFALEKAEAEIDDLENVS